MYISSCLANNKYLLTVPLSTISAICPKVMHGHQHVIQPATQVMNIYNKLKGFHRRQQGLEKHIQFVTSEKQSQRPVDQGTSVPG